MLEKLKHLCDSGILLFNTGLSFTALGSFLEPSSVTRQYDDDPIL